MIIRYNNRLFLFQIRNPGSSLCIDTLGEKGPKVDRVGLYTCHGMGGNQVRHSFNVVLWGPVFWLHHDRSWRGICLKRADFLKTDINSNPMFKEMQSFYLLLKCKCSALNSFKEEESRSSWTEVMAETLKARLDAFKQSYISNLLKTIFCLVS